MVSYRIIHQGLTRKQSANQMRRRKAVHQSKIGVIKPQVIRAKKRVNFKINVALLVFVVDDFFDLVKQSIHDLGGARHSIRVGGDVRAMAFVDHVAGRDGANDISGVVQYP